MLENMVQNILANQVDEFFLMFNNENFGRPYRELIKYHMKKMSPERLSDAVMGEAMTSPINLMDYIEEYIDAIQLLLLPDKEFWKNANCRDAFYRITELSIKLLPIEKQISKIEDAFIKDNQYLSFNLFQITTLSLAYSASLEIKARKCIGIKKNLIF